jgi:hypothetical protein
LWSSDDEGREGWKGCDSIGYYMKNVTGCDRIKWQGVVKWDGHKESGRGGSDNKWE